MADVSLALIAAKMIDNVDCSLAVSHCLCDSYIFRHNRGSEIETLPKYYDGYFALDILQKYYISTDLYTMLCITC